MSKFLSFILIFIFLGVSPSARAAPTCAAVFNQREVQKELNRLPDISFYDSLNKREKTIEKVKVIIDDLISKKMLNDPDLAYTTVLYLMHISYIDRYRSWPSIVERIIADPEIYRLVSAGKRISFKNNLLEDEVANIEKNKPDYFNFGEIPSPAFFKLFLNLLRPADIDKVDTMAEILSHKMNFLSSIKNEQSHIGLFSSIPNYNRFKIMKTILKKHLKISDKNYQEVLVINRGIDKHAVVISNQTIFKQDVNAFGVSLKVLDTFSTDTYVENKKYSWMINNQEFSAEVTYKNHGYLDLKIPAAAAPNYAQMLKDKKLTGVIVVANNLSEDTQDLKDSYLNYFEVEKFKSTDVEMASSNEVRHFLLNLAQQGKIDYFLREGHPESAYEIMITFNEKNQIYKLSRKQKGYTEDVYLIAPAQAEPKAGESLDYSSFGQALRLRSEQNQLICFNSSCHGHLDTKNNFSSVAANGFTPMGSSAMLDTFTGKPRSAVYEFLNGIRNQKSYADMTKNIKKDEDLITPDHKEYSASRNGSHIVPVIDLIIKRNFPHE